VVWSGTDTTRETTRRPFGLIPPGRPVAFPRFRRPVGPRMARIARQHRMRYSHVEYQRIEVSEYPSGKAEFLTTEIRANAVRIHLSINVQ
jgi:hypothetical protein